MKTISAAVLALAFFTAGAQAQEDFTPLENDISPTVWCSAVQDFTCDVPLLVTSTVEQVTDPAAIEAYESAWSAFSEYMQQITEEPDGALYRYTLTFEYSGNYPVKVGIGTAYDFRPVADAVGGYELLFSPYETKKFSYLAAGEPKERTMQTALSLFKVTPEISPDPFWSYVSGASITQWMPDPYVVIIPVAP